MEQCFQVYVDILFFKYVIQQNTYSCTVNTKKSVASFKIKNNNKT